jgi:hypothetical protein
VVGNALSLRRCLFAAAFALAGLSLGAQAGKPGGAVELIEPGYFHGSDVRSTQGGPGWIGFFPHGKDFQWKRTPLYSKRTRDQTLDEPGHRWTGRMFWTHAKPGPLFLVKGIQGLVRIPVKTIWKADPSDQRGDLETGWSHELKLPGHNYRLQVLNPEPNAQGLGKGASLVLTEGQISQVLYALPDGGNDPIWELLWIGDLDGDGKLDLYLSLSSHYNVNTRHLFLSSRAKPGELVSDVAKFSTTED